MRLVALLAAALLATLGLAAGGAARAHAVPSAVVHYEPDLPASLDRYAGPGNVIVVTAQQRILNPGRIRAWRAKGTIVLAYVNLVDWPNHWRELGSVMGTLYGGSFPQSWLYPGRPSNWPDTVLLDLGASSPVATYKGFTGTWGQYAVRWIKDSVIKDGSLFNGVFLDVWGDRVWSLGIGGPGSDWEAGVARWGQELRRLVGPRIYLVANNTQTPRTAAPLNGRMWESFTSLPARGWSQLDGPGDSLLRTFDWPQWRSPRLDILWRNQARPSSAVKRMLNAAALRVSRTGRDVAVGSSDHRGRFPPPFGVAPAPGPVAGRTAFGGERLGDWRADAAAGGRVAPGGPALSLAVGRSAAGRALVRGGIRPSRRVTVTATLRIVRARLARGAARPLLTVAGRRGGRQAGILRAADGSLRWASWTATAAGRRVLVVGRRAALGRWQTVRLRVDWRTGRSRDALVVAGRATAGRGGRPDGRAVTVSLGVGGSRSGGGALALLVRSVRVATAP